MKTESSLILKRLSSLELITATKVAAYDERKAAFALIEHLREIDDRILYLELGFGSLFEFAVKELGLSEGSAHRRISVMRLARDVPEVKEKLESGKITLSNAAKVQVALNSVKKKKLTVSEKTDLIESCENKTQRECEETLFQSIPELAREPKVTERVKPVSSELVEIKIVISKELNSEIEVLMKLDSHRNPKQSIAVLVESLVHEKLEREEKNRGEKRKSKIKKEVKNKNTPSQNGASSEIETKTHPAAGQTKKLQSELSKTKKTAVTNENRSLGENSAFEEDKELESSKTAREFVFKNNQSFSTEVKRTVWTRAKGKCEFPNCESSYQLEFDHIQAKALGGTSELENCRLLCRSHNIFVAAQVFGREQMGKFVSGVKIAS